MFQIINLSAEILYDQEQARSEFQQIINACVSHELRNPLNSIAAQILNQKMLFAKLEDLLSNQDLSQAELRSAVRSLLCNLYEGLEIHESSTEMMTFLVQDLLDFAQIKAEKFRKNEKPFEIENCINKVIKMHKARVNLNKNKVKLYATYSSFERTGGRISELINTD